MYCDFPAYQNLQDYYETYVYALVQEIDLWVSEHPESTSKAIDTIYFWWRYAYRIIDSTTTDDS